MTDYKIANQAEKDRLKTLRSEQYQVVLQPENYPYLLRLTYDKYKGSKIIEIEELNHQEKLLTSCKFKGKSSTGTGCEYLKEIKIAYSSMKSHDWTGNSIWFDEYYKKH